MVDYFAKFGFPRTPWLDAESLKQRFLQLSAETHPDKACGDKSTAQAEFQQLNKGYNVLRSTRTRLQHLLELEGVSSSTGAGNLPAIAAELFAPLAQVTQAADRLLKEKAAVDSPMLKVIFFEKAMGCVDELQAMQQEIQRRVSQIERTVEMLTRERTQQQEITGSIPKLQEAATALGYLERWNAQLQERFTSLTF